jgi:hypothetical protein
MRPAATVDILRRLAAHDVEFVVVGITAGVFRGAPVTRPLLVDTPVSLW